MPEINFDTLTEDDFLGGRVRFWQERAGFRAGTDTVMLAAAIPAKPGQHILELGAGAGIGLGLLGTRVPNLRLMGIEINPLSTKIANYNLRQAGLDGEVIEGDVHHLPPVIKQDVFDHVMMNPPFFDHAHHTPPKSEQKKQAHILEETLGAWIEIAARRAKPKGTLTIIHRTAQLGTILAAIKDMGNIRILPIIAREGADAERLIIQASKQSRGPLRIRAPFIMRHKDLSRSTAEEEIARDGQPLTRLYNPLNKD